MKRIALLLLLSSCTLAQRNARNAVDQTRLKEAQAVQAEQRAPIQFASYKAALQKAQALRPETPERDDYEAEARLWLETAIVIGERERLAEERLKEERAQLELDAVVVPLQRERAELGRRADLLAARAIARAEAERSLSRASQRADLRVKIPREEARKSADALLNRAALIALTLETVNASAPGLAQLRAQLAQAEQQSARDPDGGLGRADRVLFFALSLMSQLRGEEPPADDEKASLAEELALSGMRVSRGDQGLSGTLEKAFLGPQPSSEGERVLERLCALTRAHIRGPVRLSPHAVSSAQGDARVQAVRARFAKAGCSGQRFAIMATGADDDALELNFVAY